MLFVVWVMLGSWEMAQSHLVCASLGVFHGGTDASMTRLDVHEDNVASVGTIWRSRLHKLRI